jgi:hypothetical protein
MRTRFLPFGAAMALALGLLTAAPAAAYTVDEIAFPDGTSVFYSPFTGPATVTFSWVADSNDATFELRLRPLGGTAIHTKEVFIDPDTQTSPRTVNFSWPALTVGSARTYQVAVYRNNGTLQGSPESFQLSPPLVSIIGASPNPFFPWLDDGYKDVTNVGFRLAADSDAQARVFRPSSNGKCCGALVRNDDPVSLTAGNKNWLWDGTNDNGENLGKGNYFVRIWADDGVVAPALSKAVKVAIARSYRALDTKSKPARGYHHVGPVTSLVLGGDCIVFRNSSLQVLCQGARVSVYWRWGLSSVERIERASFVLETVRGCPRSIRRTGHTKHESSFTMNEDLAGASGDCRIVTAKITYSHPEQS